MTNYEWLIRVFEYFPEQLANPEAPDKMRLILIIGLVALGLFVFIIGLWLESHYSSGYAGFITNAELEEIHMIKEID